MKYLFFLLIVILSTVCQSISQHAPVIETKAGKVIGRQRTTIYQDRKVDVYEGIRYGKPPVGDLRFRKPQPAEPWQGVYNATGYKNSCWQIEIYPDDQVPATRHHSEDCLFLSVYRPSGELKKKLPVMFWIYGGGFETGTSFSLAYDGALLAVMGEVIVVTINYRLNAFGFLFSGTQEAPGNVGLHDQQLALKWVHDNIEKFGGDPNEITLFGQSAGSMSVGIHVLSPKAKGMFKRAILESGAPNSVFAQQTQKDGLQKTKDLAEKFNCDSKIMDEMVKCLRNVSAERIVEASKNDRYNGKNQSPISGDELLPINPTLALKTGQFNKDVELMFGLVSDEGSIFTQTVFPNYLSGHVKHPDFKVQQAETLMKFIAVLYHRTDGDEIAKKYLQNINTNDVDALRTAVNNVLGDLMLVCPAVFFGEEFAKHATHQNVFAYRMPHKLAFPGFPDCVGYMGPCHGDEVPLVYGIPIQLEGLVFTKEDVQLSKDVLHAWAHFAHTGKPSKMGNVEWKPALLKSGYITHMQLEPTNYTMVDNFFVEYCDNFWKGKIF